MTVLITILVAVLLPLSLILFSKHKDEAPKLAGLNKMLDDKSYDIRVYAFPKAVASIDDIIAKRFELYREEGKVQGFEVEKPIFEKVIHPNENNVFEFGQILVSAKEVKRINEKETIYFFSDLSNDLVLTAEEPQSIYRHMQRHIRGGAVIVIRVLKNKEWEDDDDEA